MSETHETSLPSEEELRLWHAAAQEAAQLGGQVLQHWRGRFQVQEKAPKDLITQADLESQQRIVAYLQERFPDHGFLAEEAGLSVRGTSAWQWVIDPLDGTVNYAHAVPQYTVSVALVGPQGPVVGVVWDPTLQECFSAMRGQGVWLNGRPIRTSRITLLREALVACSFPPRVRRDGPEVENFLNVLVQTQSLRRTGSSALNLAYVAAGRFDAYWATSNNAWDIAAGVLLVEEAGGVIRGPEGGPLNLFQPRFLAAANQRLYDQLAPLVRLAW